MYVYVYVCIYVCVYVSMYLSIYTHIDKHCDKKIPNEPDFKWNRTLYQLSSPIMTSSYIKVQRLRWTARFIFKLQIIQTALGMTGFKLFKREYCTRSIYCT